MNSKTPFGKFCFGFVSLLFFGIMFITFRSETMLPKIASMAMIPIALLAFLIEPEFDLAGKLTKLSLLMISLYIGILLLSFLIWIINLESPNYMVPGITKALYQCVNIVVALCAVYALRENAIEFAFLGAAVYNLLRVYLAVKTEGVSSILPDIIATCTTGEQTGFMKSLELNERTYAMGLFAVYYTIYGGNISAKKRIIYAVTANLLFFLGYKRIGIAAIMAAYIIYIAFRLMSKKIVNTLCYVIGIGLAAVCIIYIPFIRYNLFEYLAKEFSINLNAREGLFNIVADRYDFTPTYIGRGFGYIQEYLSYLKSLHLKYAGSSAHFIHNDILVYYIELGFWGFLGWLSYNCFFIQRYYNNTFGFPIATLYCVLNLYYYISLFTDNMAANYGVTLTFRIIMLSVAADYIMKRAPQQIDVRTLILRHRKTTEKRRELRRAEERAEESQKKARRDSRWRNTV